MFGSIYKKEGIASGQNLKTNQGGAYDQPVGTTCTQHTETGVVPLILYSTSWCWGSDQVHPWL